MRFGHGPKPCDVRGFHRTKVGEGLGPLAGLCHQLRLRCGGASLWFQPFRYCRASIAASTRFRTCSFCRIEVM